MDGPPTHVRVSGSLLALLTYEYPGGYGLKKTHDDDLIFHLTLVCLHNYLRPCSHLATLLYYLIPVLLLLLLFLLGLVRFGLVMANIRITESLK